MSARTPLGIVCIVTFLDEQGYLPTLLATLAAQTRFPDEVLLVDDGSGDGSAALAAAFAAGRPGVRLLRRPPRSSIRDRLADAGVVRAFTWALAQASEPWDVAVKLDADLELTRDVFETMERAFVAQPQLGIAGTYLSIVDPASGRVRRESCRPEHVRGPTKFYRRACWEALELPAILGWDTIDEITARSRGWRTSTIVCPAGDSIHLRPTGAHDGRLRAQYRWGTCAYAIGQRPAWVAASTTRRLIARPRVVGALAFATGWATAPARRVPRARAEVRAFYRREQGRTFRALLGAVPGRPWAMSRQLSDGPG